MVKKEDLCEWFKNLRPCKRLDYMCGLLHMCLPTELRFIGTVLEDLAKKDYHSLRDAEIKANQQGELSYSGSNILADYKLRTKIIMALALLNSSNSSCAKIIFEILERQLDEPFSNYVFSEEISEQILLILTMAVHHPAFKISQKLKLGEALNKVEKFVKDRSFYSKLCVEEPDLSLPAPEAEVSQPVNVLESVESDGSKKASIVSLEIIDYKDIPYNNKNEKSIKGYQIHSTWSNGETREVFMKHKSLHDLHLKFVGQFPDEVKKRKHIPYFPGRSQSQDLPDKQKENANEYLSQMTKVLINFPDCDVFTEPFRSGTLVRRTPAIAEKANSGLQSASDHTKQALQRTTSISSPVHTSTPVSLSLTSPSNSRTSSPTSQMPRGYYKTAAVGGHILGHYGPSHIELSLQQLLMLLNLEKYFDNLKELSVKQVIFMSAEELVKLGLPVEAQERLKKKLDKLKLTLNTNGLTESIVRVDSTPPYYQFPFMSHFNPYPHTSEYVHLNAVTHHHSSTVQLPNSNSSVDASSPPPSPLQPADPMPVHPLIPLVQTVSPPVAVASAVADIKPTKQLWPQAVDAPGSEDDRVSSLTASTKVKGRGRPQHSQSLPQISQSAEESKVSSMSLSVPHTHPTLLAAEPRVEQHQFIVQFPSVVNGYASDPLPQSLQGPPPVRGVLAIRPGPAFKTAQPTHTGQKNNLVPMPLVYDLQHPSQGMGKSNGIHIPPYMPASTNPSNPILLPQNTTASTLPLPLGTQPPPSLPEGFNMQQYLVYPTRLASSSSSALSGALHSHAPAPLSSGASPDMAQVQLPSALANLELLEPNRSEGPLLNPPSHTPPQHSLSKSQNSGPDSGTPSPPLGPTIPKLPEQSGRASNVYMYNFPQVFFQPQPNGLHHDIITQWPGLRLINHVMPSPFPYVYGNTIYSNPSQTIPPAPSNHNPPAPVTSNVTPPEVSSPGKSVCYNCGQAGHDPSKCEENTMENMSKSFRLNFKPKSDSE